MSQHKSNGKLCLYLDESSQYLDAISEIEATFTIDRSFHAERNLVEELLKLLPCLRDSSRKHIWISALQEVQQNGLNGKGANWRKIAKGRENFANPMSGSITVYQVPSFILQQAVEERYEDIVHALKVLYLEALLNDPSGHRLFSVANTLRKKVISFSFSVKELTRFSPGSLNEYFDEFKSKTDSSVTFIAELHSIIDNLISRIGKKVASKPVADPTLDIPKTIIDPKNPYVDRVTSSTVKILLPGISGINTNLRIRSVKHKGEPEASTPVLTSVISLDNEDSDSDLQIEVKINESKYWLRRHQNLVPGDWGRLTPLEKTRLSNYIKTNIVSSDVEKSKIVGLIALVYFTGRSVESLLDCDVGESAVFSKEGVYRREVSSPTDAWNADDRQIQYLEPILQQLELKLPTILDRWVSKYADTTAANTLENALELSLDQANEQVRGVLKEIKQEMQFYRITLDRIQSALALETTLMFQDEVVTYQLTSAANHAPPMLSYYISHDSQYLSQCYEQVTAQLVAQWN